MKKKKSCSIVLSTAEKYKQMSKQRTNGGFTHKMKHVTVNHTTGTGKKRGKIDFTKTSSFKTVIYN